MMKPRRKVAGPGVVVSLKNYEPTPEKIAASEAAFVEYIVSGAAKGDRLLAALAYEIRALKDQKMVADYLKNIGIKEGDDEAAVLRKVEEFCKGKLNKDGDLVKK